MTPGDRYRIVVERVGKAALRAGRDPSEVTIVAAAKGFGVEAVRSVVAAGGRTIGENYVQEARRKRASLDSTGVSWRLIGALQRNKVKQALASFDRIDSLDTVELIHELDRAAGLAGIPTVHCLLQINLAGEPTKRGVSPERAGELCAAAAECPRVAIDGLMAIPPANPEAEGGRPWFVRLRDLRDSLARLRLSGVRLKELSMGMSADFEIAVEEGATMVRIGTAIFGPRPGKR